MNDKTITQRIIDYVGVDCVIKVSDDNTPMIRIEVNKPHLTMVITHSKPLGTSDIYFHNQVEGEDTVVGFKEEELYKYETISTGMWPFKKTYQHRILLIDVDYIVNEIILNMNKHNAIEKIKLATLREQLSYLIGNVIEDGKG